MPSATVLGHAGFLDMLLDAVCVVDRSGHFVFVSAACEQIFGYTQEEMIGKVMIDMVHPEDRERTLAAAGRVMAGQTHLHFENRYLHKDGQVVHIMWSARWSEVDQLRIAVARDITESKRTASMQAAVYAISEAAHAAEDVLGLIRQVHHIIASLLPAPGLSVALIDRDGTSLAFAYNAIEFDDAATEPDAAALALCAEVASTRKPLLVTRETIGHLPDTLGHIAGPAPQNWLGVPLNAGQETIGVLALHSAQGSAAYSEADRELLQYISTQVATAIQRKQLHAQLHRMAQFDELTALPNRRLFHDRLENALARAQRQQHRLCVLFLDLDHFKQINDMFGHAAGDAVLREVGRRLAHCVRSADTVARMGGDEFVVLLDDFQDPGQVPAMVEKIRNALGQPLDIGGGRMLRPLPSVGIALYPEHGKDSQQLLRHADDAMYIEKKRRQSAGPASCQTDGGAVTTSGHQES
ncbi:sensor domain-containing protein [Massilia cavernae]|uniref:Diguanylate cyclase n=1 Tax=Massilia cavernae TaxID=2320864 RepID=A0A418XGH7_9BURK|nr:GGDEF domain-containing protein [Massilia cavernae]RJG11569.1 diguanylate cyclase [Massilia cavernae]